MKTPPHTILCTHADHTISVDCLTCDLKCFYKILTPIHSSADEHLGSYTLQRNCAYPEITYPLTLKLPKNKDYLWAHCKDFKFLVVLTVRHFRTTYLVTEYINKFLTSLVV